MSSLVQISDIQSEALDTAAERLGLPRDVLVREALDDFLKKAAVNADQATTRSDRVLSRAEREEILEKTFGLWGDRAVDGLVYTNALRDEWWRSFSTVRS